MKNSEITIFVVEDDASIRFGLEEVLRSEGFEVASCDDGGEAIQGISEALPDLIVLDVMLPNRSGYEIATELRKRGCRVPILMLTAKGEEMDKVVGLNAGADDYVTKPFSIKVLLERVKVLLKRRDRHDEVKDVVASQGIVIDRRRHQASVDGQPISLTRTEFSLLDTLLRQPGRAFSRAELIQTAIGDDALVLDRTVDVHVRSIRSKLGENAELIETVRGIGYRFHHPATVLS